MHATHFLKNASQQQRTQVLVLPGTERLLKHAVVHTVCKQMLGIQDDDVSLSRFDGKDTEMTTVRDELFTVSMWGDCRVVLVEEADVFVTENRAALEAYIDRPAKQSLLILDVKSWPKNTRLAKTIAKTGLVVDCTELTGRELKRWVQNACQECHGQRITNDAALLLTELAGNNLGLLDQELAKLASYTQDRALIDVDDVRTLVGGWKTETTWAMINSVRDGKLEAALSHLERLRLGGEAPQRILGGIIFVFRKLACATELARQGTNLNEALKRSGVFARETGGWNQYLRRIGRQNAEQLLPWLLEADNNLKGGSRLPDVIQLEQLLVRLSGRT